MTTKTYGLVHMKISHQLTISRPYHTNCKECFT